MPFLPTSASPPTRRLNVNNNHHSPAAHTRSSKENITISTGSHGGDDNDIGQRHRSPRKTREHETQTATASGRLIASHPKTVKPSASSSPANHSPPKPKPVFKMKRTGHSGPSPFPTNSGSTPSSSSTDDIPAKSLRSGSIVTAKSGHVEAGHAKVGKHRDGDRLNAPTSTSYRTPLSNISAGANHKSTSASNSTQSSHQGSKLQPKSEPDSDIIAMGDIQESDLIKAQLAMDALSAGRATRSKTQAPTKPQTINPSTEALDASAYKVWKDQDTGQLLPTCGALLPPGYEQSDHPELPWICPVRSCRALLPGLPGLGRHFGVVHRACRLNDNLDGTLTDLGRYANPTPGNGRKLGGTTKSCIIVSKKYMGLAESPIVEPRPYTHYAYHKSQPVQEVPKRELRRRSPIDGSETIQVSAVSDDGINPQDGAKGEIVPSSKEPAEKILVTAKSGRPYNMWPDQSGAWKDLRGVLLPDEWTLYSEHPTHQWICPVRSCRYLYSAKYHLANHFKMRYYGCRLNDNLDGTFSVVKRPTTGLHIEQLRIDYHNDPPVVVSRGARESEPLAEPQISQNYINRMLREHRRGKSSSTGSSIGETIIKDRQDSQGMHDTERTSSPALQKSAENARVIPSDVGFDNATDGRPYTHWLNPENNRFQVTRGLIPEGYQLELSAFPLRPWICPISSCRILLKGQAAYSTHWTVSHPNVCVNDNQDGTFSIVEGRSKSGPRVVSRGPLNYDESPLKEAQLPNKEQGRVMEPNTLTDDDENNDNKVPGRTSQKRALNETTTSSSPAPEPGEEAGHPEELRRYITSQIGGNFPEIEEAELEVLLSLSRRRDLKLKHPIPVTNILTLKQLTAVVAQLTGRKMPKSCTACRRGAGPFKGCVTMLPKVSVKLNRLVSASYRNTCANCLYDNTYNACSIKKLNKTEEGATGVVAHSGGGGDRDEAGNEPGDDAEDQAGEEEEENEEAYEYDEQLGATVIRRSQRVPSIAAAEESEADVGGVPPPRKVITFKNPLTTQASASLDAAEEEEEDVEYRRASKRLRTREQTAVPTPMQATAAFTRSLLVSEEDLVTEEWERGSRRVLPMGRQASKNLAYSSSYLSANQTIQICKSTTLTALTITSGSTHRLPADQTRTRICTLISGKLRVILNDSEDEFTVGPRGVFKLSPGATCLLENGCYLNAAVHVTAVADR